MRKAQLAVLAATVLLVVTGCGPTPAEQAAMDAAQRAQDQNRCAGFGFAPGSDGFAHCMMGVSSQRDAEAAADRRAAAARNAADQRAQADAKAAKDRADQDAWDRKTGQGAYSRPMTTPAAASSSFSFPDPIDPMRDSIDKDLRKINGSD
jgi:hypothetical protein